MLIRPQANNSITIILDNGDEFGLHSPNERELVISRPQRDKRNYRLSLANSNNGLFEPLTTTWMLQISKEEVKQ